MRRIWVNFNNNLNFLVVLTCAINNAILFESIRDRCQILVPILSDLSEGNNFSFPVNNQKRLGRIVINCFCCWLWTNKCQLGILEAKFGDNPEVNGTISVHYLLQILLKGRFRVCSKFFIFRDQILKAHFQVWDNFWHLNSFKNYEKCFLFHLKSFFGSQDIGIFVLNFGPNRKTAWLERC